MLAAIAIFSLAHYIGLDFGDQARVIVLMPLLAAVVPSAFPKFNGRKVRRILIVVMLLLVLFIPYFSQIWIFSRKVYIIMPEYRAGEALGHAYDGGKILSDSPIPMYTSKIGLHEFIAYEDVPRFLMEGNDTRLIEWLKSNGVRYLIWEKTNYTLAHEIFPFLSDGAKHTLREAAFTPIYEDSLRTGHWEHSSEYGIPDVFIYRVDYS
jgi:hypothetical protein